MMQPPLDPRLHAFRPELAAEALRGHVEAQRYVAGSPRQVVWPSVALRRRPNPTDSIDTEAVFGDTLLMYEEVQGWAWVQLDRDRYVGFVPTAALALPGPPATHRVKTLATFGYPVADIKAPPAFALPMNSRVVVAEIGERFARLASGGFVVVRHLAERSRPARDFVAVAEAFIGTPYLWGGKTRLGLDCSGLLQTAMEAAGLDCPRDSDMQQADLGTDVLIPADLEGLQRGDLVFWRGHVGIMTDGIMLLHANSHHMEVVAEPLPEAAQRIARAGSEIVAIKRLEQNQTS